MATQTANQKAALELLLTQLPDPKTRAKVLNLVQLTGLHPNDPAFLLLAGTGQLQAMLEDAPKALRQTIEDAHQKVYAKARDYLDGYEQTARRGMEYEVTRIVSEAIAKAGKSKVQLGVRALCAGTAIALSLIAFGTVGGYGWFRATTRFAPGGPVRLTLEEMNALEWAQSQEGQYARQIMDWNEDLLGGECKRQVEGFVFEEGLTIEIGTRQAAAGFCLLWVEPPSKREFF